MEIALDHGVPTDDPKQVFANAVYANFSWKDEVDSRLVWVFEFTGACIPQHGPGASECIRGQWVTILDGNTGEYLLSYSSPVRFPTN